MGYDETVMSLLYPPPSRFVKHSFDDHVTIQLPGEAERGG